jgi:quercetin dioxygenase-like cupin family protein
MSRPDGFVVHEGDLEFEGWSDPSRGPVRWRTLISGDRTPTASLTLGVAELQPNTEGDPRPHSHSQPEAYYVLSGTGVVTISGIDHPVGPGSAVFISGGSNHFARNTGAGTLRLLYVFPADSFADVTYEFPTL